MTTAKRVLEARRALAMASRAGPILILRDIDGVRWIFDQHKGPTIYWRLSPEGLCEEGLLYPKTTGAFTVEVFEERWKRLMLSQRPKIKESTMPTDIEKRGRLARNPCALSVWAAEWRIEIEWLLTRSAVVAMAGLIIFLLWLEFSGER